MGKKNRKTRSAVNYHDLSSDDDSMSTISTAWSEQWNFGINNETEQVKSRQFELDSHLDALYEKRGSTRENALSGLVKAFESDVLLEFVENKWATLLQQFINSIKRGSSKEVSLASRATGLLAITVGYGGNAHEIMTEAVQHLHQTLKSGSDASNKSSAIQCLAIISFVGADDVEEIEKSMRIIWEIIHPKSASNVTLTKPTPAVLSSAIFAWSFLLTTINQWGNNSINWKGSISFLSNLLDKKDRCVRIAAGEALALIFEINRFEKLSKVNDSDHEGGSKLPHEGLAYVDVFIGKARNLSMEAGRKGSARTDLSNQRDLFQRVLSFIETGEFDELSVTVLPNCCSPLKLSSWAQSTQSHFLKRFLGSGYLMHMTDNNLLHEVFKYTPKKRKNVSLEEKRTCMSPNSAVSKARTQNLNKSRTWSQNRNQRILAVDNYDEL